MEKLEKERSMLTVRATMAEEQLKVQQEQLKQTTFESQRKIFELTSQLRSVGVRV